MLTKIGGKVSHKSLGDISPGLFWSIRNRVDISEEKKEGISSELPLFIMSFLLFFCFISSKQHHRNGITLFLRPHLQLAVVLLHQLVDDLTAVAPGHFSTVGRVAASSFAAGVAA